MHPDLIELLESLRSNNVEFLVVGAVATAIHAQPRYADDLDLWMRRTEENVQRLGLALGSLGFTPRNADLQALWRKDRRKFTLGTEPSKVDIFNFQSGLAFEQAWERRVELRLGGISVAFIGLNDLVRVKRIVGGCLNEFDLALIEEIHDKVDRS